MPQPAQRIRPTSSASLCVLSIAAVPVLLLFATYQGLIFGATGAVCRAVRRQHPTLPMALIAPLEAEAACRTCDAAALTFESTASLEALDLPIGQGRALDLILTGRPVGAKEALTMGLVSRVVPKGAARVVAEALAEEIAAFPQRCLLTDRRSACEQWSLTQAEALQQEFARGRLVLASGESAAGAARFVDGAGRGGRPA